MQVPAAIRSFSESSRLTMLETRAAHPRPFSISVFDPHEASAESWEKFHRYWQLRTEEDHPGERRPPNADTGRALREHLPLQAFHRVLASCDGEFIGSLTPSFRREGSPDHAAFAPYLEAWGGLLRPHRRRGVRSARRCSPINHRLGFAPHRHDAVYQIGPESLRAFLSTRPLDPMERYQ